MCAFNTDKVVINFASEHYMSHEKEKRRKLKKIKQSNHGVIYAIYYFYYMIKFILEDTLYEII